MIVTPGRLIAFSSFESFKSYKIIFNHTGSQRNQIPNICHKNHIQTVEVKTSNNTQAVNSTIYQMLSLLSDETDCVLVSKS